MSTMDLAARLGVTRARVGQLQQSEIAGTIPLATLERAAAALNCRVSYFFVPNEPLEQMVRRQARDRAASIVAARTRTLDLLDSGPEQTTTQVEALTLELIDRRGLWQGRRIGRPESR